MLFESSDLSLTYRKIIVNTKSIALICMKPSETFSRYSSKKINLAGRDILRCDVSSPSPLLSTHNGYR